MKRRKFIEATLVTTALPIAAGAERLYGTPNSVVTGGGAVGKKFMLPLARTGLPPETWDTFASASQLIENVLTSKDEASKFFSNSKRYFKGQGLDASDKTLLDSSVVLLTALASPAVSETLAKKDYAATFEYFKAAGLFEPRDPSALQVQVETLMRDNIAAIRGALSSSPGRLNKEQEGVLMEVLKANGVAASEDDLAIIAQMVSPDENVIAGCTAIALCVVAVGIAAVVVAYVSVVIAATVVLAVGVVITAAVAVAVTVKGSEEKMLSTPGVSAPFTGSFAKLDPALVRNTERAVRFGVLSGDAGIQLHAMKELISEEVRAIIRALQKNELLAVDDRQLEVATSATTAYAFKTLGLSA